MSEMSASTQNFQVEEQLYEAHKREWLQQNSGRFALIKGDQLVGFYDDYESAFRHGLKHFGLGVAFLIKQVCSQEPVFTIY
jgi:hypothetical protein